MVDSSAARRTWGGLTDRRAVEERVAVRQGAAVPAAAPAAPVPSVASGPSPMPSAADAMVSDRDQVISMSPIRRRTAEHLKRSLSTAAHALVTVEVDFGEIDEVRHTASKAAGFSYLPFVARAMVDAVRRYPLVNSTVVADDVVVHHPVNLGIAVDLDFQGLVVPVIHRADELRMVALAEAVDAAAERARSRQLTPEDMKAGTITLTNVGRYGTVMAVPIINHPEVAIISTDGVRMRPVAVPDGVGGWQIAVRPVGNLSMSFDHRAFDGAYAAAFLAEIRTSLEHRDWRVELV